jgi:hypothetical protein
MERSCDEDDYKGVNLMVLNPLSHERPNFGLSCFGHVAVIRRCDMNFWDFHGR